MSAQLVNSPLQFFYNKKKGVVMLKKVQNKVGHFLRANDDTVCQVGLNVGVPGNVAGVHPDQAAFGREKWRHHSRRACFFVLMLWFFPMPYNFL